MTEFNIGDRIVVSRDCSFEPEELGRIVSEETYKRPFDYVVQLDKYKGDKYEFTENEIQKVDGCGNQDHKLLYSTKRDEWICAFCNGSE